MRHRNYSNEYSVICLENKRKRIEILFLFCVNLLFCVLLEEEPQFPADYLQKNHRFLYRNLQCLHRCLPEEELLPFLRRVSVMEGIRVRGLMAIMPQAENPEDVRQYFRRMRGWFDRLRDDPVPGTEMEILSMGMSHDCLVAAEEGATMVRLGTALFGRRA